MQRTLSSAQTFFTKFIMPVVWFILLGLLPNILANGRIHYRDGSAIPFRTPQLYWIAVLVASGFIYWFCIRLKRVRIDDEALYISNYVKEVRVPLRDIVEVMENRWVNIHPVTITFQTDTEFGRSIVFMPKARLAIGWSSHPVVAELREAARRAARV